LNITSIHLRNFRKFDKLDIELTDGINIIQAANAKGKSTILEAVHLLTNGHSPWTSDHADMISYNNDKNTHFRIEAKLHNGKETVIALFHENGVNQFFIDNKKTLRKKFSALTCSNIFSPEQIELLMISPSKRREFLDNLIVKIDLDYKEDLLKFERILRQRNAYLKKLSKKFYDTGEIAQDDQQLEFWTKEFATASTKLMSRRSAIIEELSQNTNGFKVKYHPSLTLNLFEDLGKINEIAQIHYKELINFFRRDIALGYTKTGAHRDDWGITTDKDVKRFGSRGEKRIAIGKLIFQTQELFKKYLGYYPILLLDDISSELDDSNIKKLLSKEFLNKQQVIITTLRDMKLEKFKNINSIKLK
jgi:DNA replication and repair protein RecF